mmetsp:Transcript_31618/g.101428  ORF Transcript_31618/g.101428 Transcript_31618/m.101428 type:complete len:93 (-) Transcript_31618:42-320(-)
MQHERKEAQALEETLRARVCERATFSFIPPFPSSEGGVSEQTNQQTVVVVVSLLQQPKMNAYPHFNLSPLGFVPAARGTDPSLAPPVSCRIT